MFSLLVSQPVSPQPKRASNSNKAAGTPILWRNPGNVSSRNLFYGPGSPELAPVAPFTFIKEKKSGESPKFVVRDARGDEWTVKLGPEAQAETVATRLVWAVGYFAEEAYYFDEVPINGLPALSRGRDYVTGEIVHGARFEPERATMISGSRWDWRKNPFDETRELSGLKVLMILLNNFDARSGNNRIIYVNGARGREARYYVTDLGATLGRAGGLGGTRTKNDLADFLSTKFVRGVDERDGVVEFDYDTRPKGLGNLSVLQPFYYRSQVKKEKAMRGIPVAHARWIGSLLNQLSDQQLRDAFRAAGYSETVQESYVAALRERINQLSQLQSGAPARRQRSEGMAEKVVRFNSRAVKQVRTNVVNAFSKVGSTVKGN
ncbi:MAG TPA: hypothetical protein VKA97_08445 [Pyrinomonadaceae bacterium]|nr:hypothetical protein [Pyrinomonadaceae bacterium]